MIPLSNLLAFALASVVLIAVPGPSVLFVIGRSLALGWKGGVLTVLGNATGQLVQVAAVALGVGIIVAQSVVLFSVVKLAGAAYLVYLGIKAIRNRRHNSFADRQPVAASPRRLMAEGLVVGSQTPSPWCSSWRCCRSLWTTRPGHSVPAGAAGGGVPPDRHRVR
ncbi:uncharacterized membrane protein YrhP [Arthrobacter sp. Hiyo4]|nr:uncharacterized membrane protein YrhP [Arthrobacter sp. Hiyo4]